MKKWPQCYAINVPRPPRPRAVFVVDVPRLPTARHLQRFCRVRRCTRRSAVIKVPHYCKSPAIHLPCASPPQHLNYQHRPPSSQLRRTADTTFLNAIWTSRGFFFSCAQSHREFSCPNHVSTQAHIYPAKFVCLSPTSLCPRYDVLNVTTGSMSGEATFSHWPMQMGHVDRVCVDGHLASPSQPSVNRQQPRRPSL